ncbi:hypothetical protein Q3G72_032545 [Acer saccharum]|nr:hypothetical protein Q3G72_032545 [Acer saccharum]
MEEEKAAAYYEQRKSERKRKRETVVADPAGLLTVDAVALARRHFQLLHGGNLFLDLTDYPFSFDSSSVLYHVINYKLIALADCYFTMKAWNAQKGGAATILVADDKIEPLITMATHEEENADAEYLQNITIPSALISKSLGDSIKKSLTGGEMVNMNLDWIEALPLPLLLPSFVEAAALARRRHSSTPSSAAVKENCIDPMKVGLMQSSTAQNLSQRSSCRLVASWSCIST